MALRAGELAEHSVLPLQLRALAGNREHAERELASDPAVVVACERDRTATADEVDDLGRGACAESTMSPRHQI